MLIGRSNKYKLKMKKNIFPNFPSNRRSICKWLLILATWDPASLTPREETLDRFTFLAFCFALGKQRGPLFLNQILYLPPYSFHLPIYLSGLAGCVYILPRGRSKSKIPIHHPDVSKLHAAIFGIVYIKYPYNLLIFLPHLDVLASAHLVSGNSWELHIKVWCRVLCWSWSLARLLGQEVGRLYPCLMSVTHPLFSEA